MPSASDRTEVGHTLRERAGGDRRPQPSQPNPSAQGSRRRGPAGHRIPEPRKGKGAGSGRRDGRRRAPCTPKPAAKAPTMARGGSQNWSSGESDEQPEEQAPEEGG